jgi:hypothetical protein
MRRLIARRTRLVFETPLRIGKRPLIVAVETWGLRLREKGRRHDLAITWAQVWNRGALIAADARRTERAVTRTKSKCDERNNSS